MEKTQNNPFQSREPNIIENNLLRTPQRQAYAELTKFADDSSAEERELGIVLPVGCGKSGCIAITPFAFKAKRTLVVAPGLAIAQQLADDFDPARPDMFYAKCQIIEGGPYPEPAEIRGTTTNVADLETAHVVVTNIQQLQGEDNRWLQALPPDFFDLILFDEGHHNVAASWEYLKGKFPDAKIINFSATPLRADGQLMAGRILYSYPVADAIKEGYIKRLKAVVLNPKTLRYVRREGDREIEVDLEEVRRLGEEDADFRRSIVTSAETRDTIVSASIRELEKLRRETGEKKHKIIASALNYEHCIQIVEAYKARGLRADYIHSRDNSQMNRKVLQKLENHELDVIVQVRKLGEGFDHPFLSVAAVFSIFSNLSPFIQFVGRIMRVIPGDPLNRGVVVFHAGANVARRWKDFQTYSKADQQYFDELLPMENLDFGDAEEIEIEPREEGSDPGVEVRAQTGILLEEIPLIQDDPDAIAAIATLQNKGYTAEQVKEAMEKLTPVVVTKVRERQAKRSSLDKRVLNEAARILLQRKINAEGRQLDRNRLGRSNLIVLKSEIDRKINAFVGRSTGKRDQFTRPELERIDKEFDVLVAEAVKETLQWLDPS